MGLTDRDGSLRRLFPTLTNEEITQIGDFLEAYSRVLLSIYERLEREQSMGFDLESNALYDEGKGRFPQTNKNSSF